MAESTTGFLPGLELSRAFYEEGVAPLLAREFPELPYAAARLGPGSEVLGYDTPRSTDHDWGPRLQLFLSPDDDEELGPAINETLRRALPKQIRGYSTHFGAPDREGTRLLEDTDGSVDHRVEIWTVCRFFEQYMAYDPRQEITVWDWLTWPQQHLLAVTAGSVYRDDLGELAEIRRKLSYYPRDVWLYLLAAQWSRIGQEEHFVGRTGEVGDELGSRLIASRLVHDIMQLCFLMEKTYAPYPKWFGTAFAALACAKPLTPLLHQVLDAQTWRDREFYLNQAYEVVAEHHNALGVTGPLEISVRYYHSRPFLVISAERFVTAIKDQITDPLVKGIGTNIGSIDQFSNSTDLRSYPRLHKRLQSLYN